MIYNSSPIGCLDKFLSMAIDVIATFRYPDLPSTSYLPYFKDRTTNFLYNLVTLWYSFQHINAFFVKSSCCFLSIIGTLIRNC